MGQRQVKIKKVNAFPIAAQMKSAELTMPAQIVKLTQQGFLAEVSATTLQPGQRFECTFELPVLHHRIEEPVMIIKIYNQWSGGATKAAAAPAAGAAPPAGGEAAAAASAPAAPGSGVVRLIEAHFQTLSQESRQRIVSFLNTIPKQAP